MAGEGTLSFSVASLLEDVLQQHDNRLGDLDLVESRIAEEAGTLCLNFTGRLKSFFFWLGVQPYTTSF